LTLIRICIAWFVRLGQESGFLPFEKWLLTPLYLLTLVTLVVGWIFHIPIGVLIPAVELSEATASATGPSTGHRDAWRVTARRFSESWRFCWGCGRTCRCVRQSDRPEASTLVGQAP
jgi:hypothetical protein